MVEECEALSTSDLPAIDSWIKDVPLIGPKITLQIGERQTRDATIEVVLKSRGKFIRRYFKCPHCHSPRETLYRTPRSQIFACRKCWGLVYASQRYGRKHPLRAVATPRKREGQLHHPKRQSYWPRPIPGWLDSAVKLGARQVLPARLRTHFSSETSGLREDNRYLVGFSA